MLGRFDYRCIVTQFTPRVTEVNGIDKLATFITLVPSGIFIGTQWTGTFNKSVGKKSEITNILKVFISIVNEEFGRNYHTNI